MTAAVLKQLNAEVGASSYTIKSLSKEMGLDYNTVRRYFIGERELRMPVLWAALDVLDIPEDVFMVRVKNRLGE